MRRSTKSLKRNDGERRRILLFPQSSHDFLDFAKFPLASVVHHCPTWEVGFGYKSRGQTALST
jgi:hypothetical protein